MDYTTTKQAQHALQNSEDKVGAPLVDADEPRNAREAQLGGHSPAVAMRRSSHGKTLDAINRASDKADERNDIALPEIVCLSRRKYGGLEGCLVGRNVLYEMQQHFPD